MRVVRPSVRLTAVMRPGGDQYVTGTPRHDRLVNVVLARREHHQIRRVRVFEAPVEGAPTASRRFFGAADLAPRSRARGTISGTVTTISLVCFSFG